MSESKVANGYVIRIARTRFGGPLNAASAANLRFNGRGLPSHVQALAILLPQYRGYATDPSTSNSTSSDSSFPPPGFNAEQAKKPIKTEGAPPSAVSKPSDNSAASKSAVLTQNVKQAGAGKVPVAEDEKKAADKKNKKLTLGQKVKKEVQHYWDGTKLLATEMRISSRLALKMARGYELTRREHRQVGYFVPTTYPPSGTCVCVLKYLTDILYSCKEPPGTWAGWFRSRCSS